MGLSLIFPCFCLSCPQVPFPHPRLSLNHRPGSLFPLLPSLLLQEQPEFTAFLTLWPVLLFIGARICPSRRSTPRLRHPLCPDRRPPSVSSFQCSFYFSLSVNTSLYLLSWNDVLGFHGPLLKNKTEYFCQPFTLLLLNEYKCSPEFISVLLVILLYSVHLLWTITVLSLWLQLFFTCSYFQSFVSSLGPS